MMTIRIIWPQFLIQALLNSNVYIYNNITLLWCFEQWKIRIPVVAYIIRHMYESRFWTVFYWNTTVESALFVWNIIVHNIISDVRTCTTWRTRILLFPRRILITCSCLHSNMILLYIIIHYTYAPRRRILDKRVFGVVVRSGRRA